MNAADAMAHACRLLREAEMERSNTPLMKRYEGLADSWHAVGRTMAELDMTIDDAAARPREG